MTKPSAGPPTLAVPLARAGYGAVLLCAPGPVIRACTGHSPSRQACRVARVLGARHLAQAVVTAWAPEPGLVVAGAAADLCHAASMLVFAGANPALRRAELADGFAAAVLAVVQPAVTFRPRGTGRRRTP